LFSWIKAAGGIAAAVLIRNRAAGVAAAVAIAVVEDLWPMRDMVLQMDRHAAFAALLSALAGAAWWGIGRGLGAAVPLRHRAARYRGDGLRASQVTQCASPGRSAAR
jgi:hypothetical protein